jgi:hypothetical protein
LNTGPSLSFDGRHEDDGIAVRIERSHTGAAILVFRDRWTEDEMSLTHAEALELRDLIDQM